MELLKNLEGLSADEQMSAVVELQKAAMKHLEEQKQASIGKSAEMVILGLKKIKSDFEAKFDSLNYDIQTKVANLKDGEQGLQGPKGEQGDRGLDGYQGKDGRDGKDGKDGLDGVDGVSVRDAKIDFDGSLVITLSDGREINVGEVVPVDVAEKIRTVHNIQSGSGGDSQTVLDAIAALQATIATYGTMATQNANNVAITGGTINNTTIGATTPSTGVFTTLTGNSTSQFGRSSANYLQATGGDTTKAVEFKALGSDTNISQVFQSKGTGAIDLAAGSSGVNISNGGTVTALTRTGLGFGYTSFPSIEISAPTTAGGVQATASVASVGLSSAVIVSGGTGYTVNDVLTISGATGTVGRVTVTSVSAGVITGVSTSFSGAMTYVPSNPAGVTGGTGSSATFTFTYYVNTFTITNAGSGYVEQPTVTFSGGGGSGAAAYATVGSAVILKSIGGTLDLSTTNGIGLRIYDSGGTIPSAGYWAASSGTSSPFLWARGGTNTAGLITSSGTGAISIQTNSGSQTQFVVAHTASAVNYVQVTGAATGNNPSITVQGSDASRSLNIGAKGTTFVILSNNGTVAHFSAGGTGSAVNYLNARGNAAGTGPALEAVGSDTNISLVLQPKGTGALQAQQTDSTATGGNARGAKAVDWQMDRSAASKVASGNYSVVGGGYDNVSSGTGNVVLAGYSNTAIGSYTSVGGGRNNTAGGGDNSAVVGGLSNTSAGYFNFIGGGFTNSGTSSSAVTTQSATMNATTAVTLSGSNASIKVGQYITGTSIAGDTYVAAVSGTSLTLSKVASGSSTSTLSFYTPHGVVVGGGNNQATGAYSFIGGGGDAGTAANRNVASGDWAVVGGGRGNQATGAGAVIAGGGTDGANAFANTATSTICTVSGGFLNNATAYGAVIIGGGQNTSNGVYSTILGGGQGTARGITGYTVFPATNTPIANATGVSQGALLVLGRQTTDATATVLRSDTSAASTNNQVILPNNSAYAFRGTVIANVTGGGNTKAWSIEGAIKRGANAASTALVGTPTVTSAYADVGAATWAITATADTTNGGLAITFTGQASTTIRVVAKLETTEVTF